MPPWHPFTCMLSVVMEMSPVCTGRCVCVGGCIASLLVGFGVSGLLQPGSMGLGSGETLGSEMH